MSKTEVIAVIIKLFSIFLFIKTMRYLPQMIPLIQNEWDIRVYLYVTILVIMFLASILLWNYPQIITKKILTGEEEVEKVKWENDSILSIGFIILGVYFFYYALIDIMQWFIVFLGSLKVQGSMAVPLKSEEWTAIFLTFVEIFISLYLIFGSRGVSNLIIKFRGR